MNKCVLGVSSFVILAGVLTSFATPTISDLKVTPIEPIGVAIDYIVSDATEDDAEQTLDVSMSVNGINYVAQSLSGASNWVNGAHRVYWNMAKDGVAIEPATAILTMAYPKYSRYCVIDLKGGSSAISYPVAYMNTPPKEGFNTTEYKTTKLVLKRVDAGSFTMGASGDRLNTLHTVKLSKPFYMGLFEVTQKQWELVMGTNVCSSTNYGKGDDYPVHYVSYDDIRGSVKGAMWPSSNAVDSSSFLGKLRDRTKLDFDLPIEAQWECACRAGTMTRYSYGNSADGEYMWCYDNSSGWSLGKYSKITHEVGTKLPNDWGFYDMHGNVQEWCLDWFGSLLSADTDTDPVGSYSGSQRVLRGGSWHVEAAGCDSTYREWDYPSNSCGYSGFRISRTLP